MAEDIPLDVALSSVLAAAIDHSDRQALMMALHRQPPAEATATPEEPPSPADADETPEASEPATAARRLVAGPAPRPHPEPGPDGEARGGAVVLAFTPRREWEPEDPPPAA
jgi:hypothetical protein